MKNFNEFIISDLFDLLNPEIVYFVLFISAHLNNKITKNKDLVFHSGLSNENMYSTIDGFKISGIITNIFLFLSYIFFKIRKIFALKF